MMPMPMPGPMAARPYPMEPIEPVTSAIRLIMSRPSSGPAVRAGAGWADDARAELVVGVQRAGDVDGREQGEDERLERLDEELERGEDDGEEERRRRADDADERRAEQVPRRDGERREQQVTGEHVGEQPDRQR